MRDPRYFEPIEELINAGWGEVSQKDIPKNWRELPSPKEPPIPKGTIEWQRPKRVRRTRAVLNRAREEWMRQRMEKA